MMTIKYEYPVPNHGSDYLLSEAELVELLEKAYKNGFENGVIACTPPETTTTTIHNIIL